MKEKMVLKGVPASGGIVEGVVKVVSGPQDNATFDEGDILVARFTEPSMVLMMNKAAAVVTDIGGLTSHAAIITRELGIPCVTNTKVGTTVLKDGERVRVDGDKGEVSRIT